MCVSLESREIFTWELCGTTKRNIYVYYYRRILSHDVIKQMVQLFNYY